MKFTFVFLLALLAGCSSSNDLEKDIIGSWVVSSLNGETDLYKAFVGTTMTFNSDNSFSRGVGSKTYLEGTYKIKGKILNMKWNNKEHSSAITIKGTELYFQEDLSFSSSGVPMKSIYKKK